MESIEVKLNKALAENETLKAENASLKEAVTTQKTVAAKAERANLLKESKLPEPCVARIDGAFAKSTDNAGLKEAINVEAEYVKSLQGPITKHNGAGDNGGTLTEADQAAAKAEQFKERQYKAYIASGASEVEASKMSGFSPKK